MLSGLEPSVELTGGPWYTDNELDTEFIKNLSAAILHYIKDRVCVSPFVSCLRTHRVSVHSRVSQNKNERKTALLIL